MALEHYLREIRKYPALGKEEESKVAALAKEGDFTSRELLIKSNLRFVIKIARKYSRNRISEDIIQQGNQGLILAVDKFNLDLGCRFSTYATWWIKNGIFSYFEDQKIIKLPYEQIKIRKKIHKFIADYLNAHSEEPSYEQIAAELNKPETKKYSAKDVEGLLRKYEHVKVFSLNKQLSEDANNEVIDVLEDVNGKNALESMVYKSAVDIINKQIINLKTDELTIKILKGRLYNNKSFEELSEDCGLKIRKVKGVYEKGIRLLKRHLMTNHQFVSSRNSFQDIR